MKNANPARLIWRGFYYSRKVRRTILYNKNLPGTRTSRKRKMAASGCASARDFGQPKFLLNEKLHVIFQENQDELIPRADDTSPTKEKS